MLNPFVCYLFNESRCYHALHLSGRVACIALDIPHIHDKRVQNIAPLSDSGESVANYRSGHRTNTHQFLPGNEVTPSRGEVGGCATYRPARDGSTSLHQGTRGLATGLLTPQTAHLVSNKQSSLEREHTPDASPQG